MRLAAPCHPLARVGRCFPSRPALPYRTRRSVGYPPDSERVPQLSRAAGERRAKRAAACPGSLPAADVGAMPTWHRNSLGVGRVARRARLVIKPNEDVYPPYPKGGV